MAHRDPKVSKAPKEIRGQLVPLDQLDHREKRETLVQQDQLVVSLLKYLYPIPHPFLLNRAICG